VRAFFARHPGASVFGLLAGLLVLYEIVASFVAYTTDAFVVTDVVVVAPQVAGPVAAVAVKRNQTIAAGALLFSIDPTPFQFRVDELKAELALAQANHAKALDQASAAASVVKSAQATLDDAQMRFQRLAAIQTSGAVTVQAVDDAKRDFDTAAARVAELTALEQTARQDIAVQLAAIGAAQASLAKADYDLAQTRVVSSVAGTVAPYEVKEGDFVGIGTPVMAVVGDRGWRIVANLPDYYLGALEVGQPVWVHVSSDPWRLHRASVRSVPRGISRQPDALRVLPYVSPTTEWIRLPRRFPVEIDIEGFVGRVPLFSGADARVLMWANTFATRPAPAPGSQEPARR
jgi:multidrug efflux system membrane fusion protein